MGGPHPLLEPLVAASSPPPDRGAMGLGSGEYAAAPEKLYVCLLAMGLSSGHQADGPRRHQWCDETKHQTIARNITRFTRILLEYYENSTKGVSLVTVVDRFLPIFRTFLGEYTTSMLLFDVHADFFGRCVLRRN